MADLDGLIRRYRGEIEDYLGLDEADDIADDALLAMETAALLVAARIRARSAGWDDGPRIARIAEAGLIAMTAAAAEQIIREPGIPTIRPVPDEEGGP